ncbi:hypothetical protein V6N11_011962 [Hibiscus sabdariffa]|uniref:Uncharacterized protein n=2 Tax=Hibiscus sabdariffa TaxID=183260 RepID=A0ABR1ZCJ7_9ROSI
MVGWVKINVDGAVWISDGSIVAIVRCEWEVVFRHVDGAFTSAADILATTMHGQHLGKVVFEHPPLHVHEIMI